MGKQKHMIMKSAQLPFLCKVKIEHKNSPWNNKNHLETENWAISNLTFFGLGWINQYSLAKPVSSLATKRVLPLIRILIQQTFYPEPSLAQLTATSNSELKICLGFLGLPNRLMNILLLSSCHCFLLSEVALGEKQTFSVSYINGDFCWEGTGSTVGIQGKDKSLLTNACFLASKYLKKSR